MTDAELNLAIAKLVYPESVCNSFCLRASVDVWLNDVDILVVDYLNNWNDLMPLVVKYELDFYACLDGEWSVDVNTFNILYDKTIKAKNDNPQRALAECVLKALESKDE